MPGAPAGAIYTRKEDGKKVLASTMGNWLGGPNHDVSLPTGRLHGCKEKDGEQG